MSQRELPDIPGLNLSNPATTSGGSAPATPPPVLVPQFAAMQQPVMAQPAQAPVALPAAPQSLSSNPVILAQEVAPATAPTDDDLDDESVDEEWVNKAKAVVEQMQADPYTEAQTLNKLKAEYLQRRFGKKIKIDS